MEDGLLSDQLPRSTTWLENSLNLLRARSAPVSSPNRIHILSTNMPSAWQVTPSPARNWRTTEGVENLHLARNVPRPQVEPRSALVRIKAAALNARDMMVIAHDPIYPIPAVPDLVPCADGAGIVEEVGEKSRWKIGDLVLLTATGWIDGPVPTLQESEGLGAGGIHGTLREYAVVVGSASVQPIRVG